jgi:hypothetical protein
MPGIILQDLIFWNSTNWDCQTVFPCFELTKRIHIDDQDGKDIDIQVVSEELENC